MRNDLERVPLLAPAMVWPSMLLVALAASVVPPLSAEEESPAASRSAVEVDRARGEVRIPATFIQASRQIEVFACHTSGPTHETVLAFDAEGPELLRALREIGCRPADHWNVTSPDDFWRNQGDRVLVLVRWKGRGGERELPAEAMLVDDVIESPSFLRGFSFSAREPVAPRTESPGSGAEPPGGDESGAPLPGGDAETFPAGGSASLPGDEERAEPRAAGFPAAVEITLGALQRQSSVFSLLGHPTALNGQKATPESPPCRALAPWTFLPLVNTEIVDGFEELARARAPATLILRRLPSERALLEYARETARARGTEERLPLYGELEPLAAEIDRLKKRYEALGERTRALVGADLSEYYGDMRPEFAGRGRQARLFGRWLCARIQELYFQVYYRQEAFRLERLRERSGLDPQVLETAAVLTRDGLRFEPLLAAEERAGVERSLEESLHEEEAARLELERRELQERASLRYEESRLEGLGPEDAYLRELLAEEVDRYRISIRALVARRQLVELRLQEIRAFLAGRWDAVASALEARRRQPEKLLRVLRLERDLLEIRQNLRWERSDAASDVPERKRHAREQIETLERRREELRAELEEARAELRRLEAEGGPEPKGG